MEDKIKTLTFFFKKNITNLLKLPQNLKIVLALFTAFGLTIILGKTIFFYGTPRVNPTYIASLAQRAQDFLANNLFGVKPVPTSQPANLNQAPTTTPQSNTTTAPQHANLNISGPLQTGAILMSWFYCPPPDHTCVPADWYATPPGTTSSYPDGSYYNPGNYFWWYLEASDMTCAGLDIAYVYVWDNPNNQYIGYMGNLSNAINQLQSPLKVSEFWDASYASNDGGSVDLGDSNTAQYRYNKFIKPFYQAFPQSQWATLDGRPILAIYRFGGDSYTNSDKADVFFTNIKSLFKNDFTVEPVLILGTEWYEKTPARNVADGEFDVYNGGVSRDGTAHTHTVNGLTISNISPGGNDYRPEGSHLDRQDGQVFKNEFGQVPGNTNLLMIESWNELGEGSGIERATYPKSGEGTLPTTTFYMDTLRNLLGKNDRPACLGLANVTPPPTSPPGQPTYTPVPGQPTSPPGPTGGSVTINTNPQTPTAKTQFKVTVSSSTNYTWVHLNIFDSAGKNTVWIAPTNGTQPTVTKSGGKNNWTYTVSGLSAGTYQIYFYINCNIAYPHCQQAPFTDPFAKANLTIQ